MAIFLTRKLKFSQPAHMNSFLFVWFFKICYEITLCSQIIQDISSRADYVTTFFTGRLHHHFSSRPDCFHCLSSRVNCFTIFFFFHSNILVISMSYEIYSFLIIYRERGFFLEMHFCAIVRLCSSLGYYWYTNIYNENKVKNSNKYFFNLFIIINFMILDLCYIHGNKLLESLVDSE